MFREYSGVKEDLKTEPFSSPLEQVKRSKSSVKVGKNKSKSSQIPSFVEARLEASIKSVTASPSEAL